MQRPKNAALQELVERLTGSHFDNPAQRLDAPAIFEDLAGLMGERQAGQTGNEFRYRRLSHRRFLSVADHCVRDPDETYSGGVGSR